MKALYITSAETFSGKSALCVGLGCSFRKDGLKAGYMKPSTSTAAVKEGVPFDEDVIFAKTDVRDDASRPTSSRPWR